MVPGMRSAKLLIGAAAVAALAAHRAHAARSRPGPGEENMDELREQLRRELERLAGADIKASRSRRESTSPPG
jgi:hypothetical protein